MYASGTTASTTWGNTSRTIYIQWTYAPPPPPRPKPVTLNAYAILGVPDGAPLEQVRQRYRQLAKQLHPDAGGDVKWMAIANRAYDAIRGKQ